MDITFVGLRAAEPAAVTELLVSVFVERNDHDELAARWAADPQRNVLFASEGDTLVGVASVRLVEQVPYAEAFGVDLSERFAGKRIAALNLIAVLPPWRKRSVASMLVRHQLQWLVQHGVDAALGVSWDHQNHGGMGSSIPMFERGGFEVVATRDNFYRELHVASGQQCPRCQPEPCSCRAILFVCDQLPSRDSWKSTPGGA